MQLEPRTATPKARLNLVSRLAEVGVPVTVMAAPMIPMINDMELEKILRAASEAGASYAGYVLLRLPYEVKILFKQWLARFYPDRAQHVISLLSQMRNGKEYEAKFGTRMRGEGHFAELLAKRFEIACKRFNLNQQQNEHLVTTLFKKPVISKQLELTLEL